jgi:hypothetical protein
MQMESSRRAMNTQRLRSLVLGALVAWATVSCTAGGSTASPSSSPPPSATQAGTLAEAQLKLRLLEQLGQLWYCDPDFYPIARLDEQNAADERLHEIQRDTATYEALLAHLGIPAGASLSAAQRLAVYRTWKQINAIQLTPADGAFRFGILVHTDSSKEQGKRVTGTIDTGGSIHVERETAEGPPPCPICLARGTLIDGPDGGHLVEDLRSGERVWTLDARGRRVAALVERVGSTPVPPTHEVVHLVLADGRELWVSPGHPLEDGRSVGQLRAGDRVDGSIVLAADLGPYAGGATFDLLPSGSTGTYWANGILLRSTLLP